MLNLLTDIDGVSVGHATDLHRATGVTVVVFDRQANASVSILGGAPGSRDSAMLDPANSVQAVDALVLSGGSIFGLDATGGVLDGLRADGRGLAFGNTIVPIAAQAILFDLMNGGDKDWGEQNPYQRLGHAAYRAARKGAFALGTVGAGTGATTARLKGGLGSASAVTSKGHRVAALVAVNALGSPTVGTGPHFWAAPFEIDGEFGGLGYPPSFRREDTDLFVKGMEPAATTIGMVVTDARLSKAECHRLAILGQDGLVRSIHPAHFPSDGDTVFGAATGEKPVADPLEFMEICHLAMTTMARAVARGLYEATALPQPGARPAWRDIHAKAVSRP
ncbi:P1 family peptidase [Gellertiella hungarica]|uniref:L-aminopeptidase/D-esterase-like protein n=1 Tax=Gellertiella hungarica TaxID=1572859 RepID=A0A7W6J181_9HYPH|nr:P1 family peptidase [Gellertiella hungarica]MBB4062910.1 L-aminopeptidase/D-esterase-like protein [Gellertiella hungarica]